MYVCQKQSHIIHVHTCEVMCHCAYYMHRTHVIFAAQIETNRNTALTLACFQGRHEVVNLLVDKQANVEHRAKVHVLAAVALRALLSQQ